MSAGNVEVVRRSYEQFQETGEIPWEMFDPDIEVRDHDLPDAIGEVFRGHEGYERWIAIWDDAWEEYEVEPTDLVDAGDDKVIAIFILRAKGKGSGVETKRENAVVYTIKDAKVARCDYYGDPEKAFEAAGAPDLRTKA
jgi:ketosteroid isomerase-like protein